MAGDLDDILIHETCPKCGASISIPYGTVRITKAMACSCGALLRVELSLPQLEAVERLIGEVAPLRGEND